VNERKGWRGRWRERESRGEGVKNREREMEIGGRDIQSVVREKKNRINTSSENERNGVTKRE
jgi:hypothetical protein